jgi:hypothetical protein
VLDGDLDGMIDALIMADQADRLASITEASNGTGD